MHRVSRLLAAVTAAVALGSFTGSVASAAPAADLPAPTALAASNGTNSIQLSWRQPPTGPRARSFRVYENSTVVARHTSTSVVLDNLGFGTAHTYTVTAVDARGNESPRSAPISRTVWAGGANPTCFPPPGIPLTVTDLASSAVSLTWPRTDWPNPINLRIGSTIVPTSGTSARIGGLAPGTAYAFALVTSSCTGQVFPVGTLTVTTPAGPDARPGTPVAPAVTAVTDTSATLSWNAPADGSPATRYAVYEGAALVAVTGATSLTVDRLYHAQTYTYTVAALDEAGSESVHGPLLRASTDTCPAVLAKPVDVRAEVRSASTVRLSWVQISKASQFTVYDGSTVVATTTAPAALLSGLASGSRHSYRVRATLINGCGDSARSAAVAVRTLDGASERPAAPAGVSAVVKPLTSNSSATVVVSWSPVASAVSYRVYENATAVATSVSSSADVTVGTNTRHTYAVTAVDAAGNESVASAPVSVQVPYFPVP